MGRSTSGDPPPVERPSVGEGVRSLFSGFAFIASNPGVWLLALAPVAVAIVLAVTLGWTAVEIVPPRIEALFGTSSSAVVGVLAFLAKITATLLAILVAGLISFGLAQPLSGPALERIVRRVEADMGAPAWPPTSIVQDVWRSLQSVLISSAFGLPILAVLFVIGALFPPAVFVTVPLKIAVTAVLITWDLCDYPLSIRGVPVGRRVAFLADNARAVIGFGVGLALLSLLPCLLLLALPAGVAGAARLIVLLERFEASSKQPPGGARSIQR